MSSDPIEISIVIPLYNEEEGIQALLDALVSYHKTSTFEFEIVFVDDGSKDKTIESILKYGTLPFPSKLVSLSTNFGSHAAVRAGFINVTGKFTTCIPADLQISFDTIEKLYSTALENYDVIFGVREVNEIGLPEKIFSRIYARIMQKYVNRDFPYKGLETFMINSKVRKVINENIESNSSLILQVMAMGYRSKFINIEKVARSTGKSKWTLSKKIKLLIDSFIAFSFAPIRLVSIVGICFFFIGVSWSAYLVLEKLLYDDLASGWPALLSVLLIGFGITNISLGIIAEYLWRTLDASRRRPVFIINEIIELKK